MTAPAERPSYAWVWWLLALLVAVLGARTWQFQAALTAHSAESTLLLNAGPAA